MSNSLERARNSGLTDLPTPPSRELVEEYLHAVSVVLRAVMDEHEVPEKDRQSHFSQTMLNGFQTVIAMAFSGRPADPRVLLLNEQAMREVVQDLSEVIDLCVAKAHARENQSAYVH